MTTVHKIIGPMIGGDDWMINVQLLDQNSDPFNIDDIEVKWLLHNPRAQIVEHHAVISTIDAPSGKISIWLPHGETTKFVEGVYTDYIRVVCNNIVSTVLMGNITVLKDPWTAEIAASGFIGFSTADVVVLVDRKERISRRAPSNDDDVIVARREMRRP